MKQVLWIIMVCFTFITVQAEGNPVLNNEGKTFTLDFSDWKSPEIYVDIINNDGDIVYNEELNSKVNTYRKYDFSKIPTGEYRIVLRDELKKVVYNFEVNRNEVSISEPIIRYSPVVTVEDKHIDLNMLALGEDVKVTITDNNGETLYEKTEQNVLSLNKRFNLDKLESGNYRIIISSDNEWFSHEVKI